jgi:uncharacterized protein YbaP (TraB family)
MGFYEDYRIRRKNAAYEKAATLYLELKSQHVSDTDIVFYIENNTELLNENEVLNALTRICNSQIKSLEKQKPED